MAKKSLQRYLAKIKKDHNISLTEENYKDIILKELESPPSLLDYFRDYMEKNKAKLTLEWGCLLFLFIKADEEKYVPDIEKYYKLLERYPPNCFIVIAMAELQLRYYGNIFKARDGFLKGLELKPDDAHCHYTLGFVYHLLGVFDKSFEHYEKAVINYQNANKPKEIKARSLYNLAVFKIMVEHDYEEGERFLKEALVVMPWYPEAKRALRQIRR
jgi:tetratricopeptide (TPR) repeat protein